MINLTSPFTSNNTSLYEELKHLIQHHDTPISSRKSNIHDNQTESSHNKSPPVFIGSNSKIIYQRKKKKFPLIVQHYIKY